MKPVTIIVAKYVAILLVASLALWWIIDFSGFNVPEHIPFTPIRIDGVIIFVFVLTIMNLSQREVIKQCPDVSVFRLTLIGALIGFLDEILFQSIRVFTLEADRLYYFSKGVVGMTIFDAVISFFVAYQIKTKNTNRLTLYIIIFLVLFKILLYLFPSISG